MILYNYKVGGNIMDMKAINEYRQVKELLNYIGIGPLELDEQVFIEYIKDNGFKVLQKELIIKRSEGKESLNKNKLYKLYLKAKRNRGEL
jgi:hypothetical protein